MQSFVSLMNNEIKLINQMQEKIIGDCKGNGLISNVSDFKSKHLSSIQSEVFPGEYDFFQRALRPS